MFASFGILTISVSIYYIPCQSLGNNSHGSLHFKRPNRFSVMQPPKTTFASNLHTSASKSHHSTCIHEPTYNVSHAAITSALHQMRKPSAANTLWMLRESTRIRKLQGNSHKQTCEIKPIKIDKWVCFASFSILDIVNIADNNVVKYNWIVLCLPMFQP